MTDARQPAEHRLSTVDIVLAVIMFAIIMLAGFSVVNRYVFPSMALAYLDQMLPDLLVWISLLGAAVVIRERGHLGLTWLEEHVGARARRALQIFHSLVGIAFFAVLLWKGFEVTRQHFAWGITSPMGYPSWLISAAVPAASAVALVHLVRQIVKPSASQGTAGEHLPHV